MKRLPTELRYASSPAPNNAERGNSSIPGGENPEDARRSSTLADLEQIALKLSAASWAHGDARAVTARLEQVELEPKFRRHRGTPATRAVLAGATPERRAECAIRTSEVGLELLGGVEQLSVGAGTSWKRNDRTVKELADARNSAVRHVRGPVISLDDHANGHLIYVAAAHGDDDLGCRRGAWVEDGPTGQRLGRVRKRRVPEETRASASPWCSAKKRVSHVARMALTAQGATTSVKDPNLSLTV